MVELYKRVIADQYEAVLRMVWDAIRLCPDEAWDAPVARLAFSTAAFHVLFATDMYLSPSFESVKDQAFHKERASFFGDYEEMQDKEPERVYEREGVLEYLEFCRGKAREVVAGETEASLAGASGFPWLDKVGITRAELHVYNIRHIHHHAAQFSLRHRLDGRDGVPWCKTGWDGVVKG